MYVDVTEYSVLVFVVSFSRLDLRPLSHRLFRSVDWLDGGERGGSRGGIRERETKRERMAAKDKQKDGRETDRGERGSVVLASIPTTTAHLSFPPPISLRKFDYL